ncbi:MAG: M99 family carboxypeptidase catalytic domain-containing protein [Syntrophales bacterium]|nr:M99 family carboxypeptidase catalytic domain-containing protein [Syntrophales bacterium]
MTPARLFLRFKSTVTIFCVLSLAALACVPAVCHGKNTLETFFQNTDYELNVYRINGKLPGKTLLIIGGIQGDEPGGFLSADLYADMELVRGNLIVVPRANFYSIILNKRQINEDMNRKFSGSSRENYEAQVVSILKRLITESNCLLNLHDGSGFYRDIWQSEMKNPARYGQSIIVDCEGYKDLAGNEIPLGKMAKIAISKIN